jgi:hypothetical protein
VGKEVPPIFTGTASRGARRDVFKSFDCSEAAGPNKLACVAVFVGLGIGGALTRSRRPMRGFVRVAAVGVGASTGGTTGIGRVG